MNIKKHANGCFWLILGIAMCISSLDLKLGPISKPGPGFFPFLCGAFLTVMGVLLFFPWVSRENAEKEDLNSEFVLTRANIRIISLTLGSCVCCIFLMDYIGFFTSNFLLFLFLFKVGGSKGWKAPLVLSSLVIVASYFLFSVWLHGQFPSGILKFK